MYGCLFILVSLVTCSTGQTTGSTIQGVLCSTVRPEGCTAERPTDCADEDVQLWLPQAITGVQGACGRCYYCKSTPTFVVKENCPSEVCPVISPLCNRVQPVFTVHDGRRCRGCSECVSYNNCPQLNCPRRIIGCEVYGPNYQYINGELCPACRVCLRYKGDIERPESTPLPCPVYNESACHLVEKCARYQERYVNMGLNRQCQVCPECMEWKDPNDRIPEITIGRENTETALCSTAVNCATLNNCEVEMVYRSEGGTICRDCDQCVRQVVDGGSDSIPTRAPQQTCPDLSRCPSLESCSENIVNKTVRISTDEICPWCSSCGNQPTDCPVRRCPGHWCSQTAVFMETINNILCEVCVCTDNEQDCSTLQCPAVNCESTVNGSVIIGDHICDCPVCNNVRRNSPDGGSDLAQPDVRNVQRQPQNRPTHPTTPAQATTAEPSPTTSAFPDCVNIVSGMTCPHVDCALVVVDVIAIDGVGCYSCPRCVSDIPGQSKCPPFNCPTVHCGDSEDIAEGRRYREIQEYNVSGEICDGCEVCLDCPILECSETLDPRCERYTRITDSRGCVQCPVCDIWISQLAPLIVNVTGFLQSVATSRCITSYGNFSNSLPGLLTSTCMYNTGLANQQQVWTWRNDGLMEDVSSQMCASYYSPGRPLIMRQCNPLNLNMVWELESNNRYPQFFRIRHPRTEMCLDIGEVELDSGIPLVMNTCEDFALHEQNWSGQWWKFEQFY